MGIKIQLSITLEEFSTAVSHGEEYKCRVIANANGIKKELIFNDPLAALEHCRSLTFAWVHTFVKLKRDTRDKLKNKPKIILP